MNSAATQNEAMAYTISHFKEVARQNRFAENGKIAHETGRCAVCNPGIAGRAPFLVYLEVIVQSVLVGARGWIKHCLRKLIQTVQWLDWKPI